VNDIRAGDGLQHISLIEPPKVHGNLLLDKDRKEASRAGVDGKYSGGRRSRTVMVSADAGDFQVITAMHLLSTRWIWVLDRVVKLER
jgi:hypothetical protein